ncbi:Ribosomal large subunit pseudouridine(746) synthase @ tRNA pseudouridine(32) synthase [hydrothermal vent metagenome]|uniref:Dual-specificity RNA pseudouridine synthase RluA n=1 Tax=hydrothermal vent metagenome TaxID=652676 RepID=A0A3B0VXW5_9ZZZZ
MIYKPPMDPYLNVVYQDDDVLVLNKPSGLLSVPGRQVIHKDSLQSRAQQQYPTATTVHRLDMETSGLILMALNKTSHVNLSRQFEQREISKQYRARVFGHLHSASGQVEAPLICDWPNRPRQMVDYEKGKAALTHWQVIEAETQTTLVELKPVTGRSHQLRVHMMSIGHPIVGDPLYANDKALNFASRLALQSQSISFQALQDGSEMNFHLPADF